MTPRKFFMGRALGLIVVLVVVGIVAAVYSFSSRVLAPATLPTPSVISTPTTSPSPVAENPEGEADPSYMSLGMKSWVWISVTYSDGRQIRPAAGKVFTVTFGTNGKFTATTDCNSMGGSYVAGKDTISFLQISSTKKYCEGSQERDFASVLEKAEGYHFTSRGELIFDLKFDSGSAVFR